MRTLLALLLCTSAVAAGEPAFLDAEVELAARFGPRWEREPQEHVSRAIVEMAETLPVGGAIDLPYSVPCGTLDFRSIADGVQVTGGWGGTLVLGRGQSGIQILASRLDQVVDEGVDRPLRKLQPGRTAGLLSAAHGGFEKVQVFGDRSEPASNLFSLFTRGGIHIKQDVKNCAWICGENAFGRRTVTAEARVDDSLFLWFGINWPFQDYNAHWNPKNAGKDWTVNAQMWFDLKGGGRGTRLYEMIETSYGNPGPTAVFQNCNGLAVYHGSTERASSQGPGVYWLKNCEGMQLGLRGINAFGGNYGDPRNADAARDLTVEGGKGNVLHAMRTWSNANEISLWNSDPELQQWMVASQYGQKGVENTLRFAVTPYFGRPTPRFLETFDAKAAAEALHQKRSAKMKTSGAMKDWPAPESVEQLAAKMKAGRHMDAPYNATDEETFLFGKADLTKGEKPSGKLPAPPSVPATNAPRTRVPVAFTQRPNFGKALLDAGADPTGKQPSDDAFAKVMYGMTRAELQKLLDDAAAADAAIWKLHGTHHDSKKWDALKDNPEFKAEREKIAVALGKILAARDARKKDFTDRKKVIGDALTAAKRAKKADEIAKLEADLKALESSAPGNGAVRLEIPAGTFRVAKPIYLLGGISGVWGAGPDKTTLITDQPVPVLKMQERCPVANLTVAGGTVGLAMTGHNHGYNIGSPTLKSYIAGEDFYAITFRDQTFAGIHVGHDDRDVMDGAEHDQNKYVDLKFLNTGEYGIYVNGSMLDKWLCLHGEFVGQKKAGIAIPFNNLIHGCVVGSTFRDIDGPGIDALGGNPDIAYRPWQLWIDQCEFLECGSVTQPAVDQGYVELAAFTHSKIVTKSKAIAGGYAGSPQVCEDNLVDVKLASGAPALKLRSVRHISVSRTNGHCLRNVVANGPVAFVNDSNAKNEFFAKTRARYGKADQPLKWDTNPMAGPNAPKNGWVHPYLFYRCEFAGEKHAYSLLNVDPDAGKVLETVDLSKFE